MASPAGSSGDDDDFAALLEDDLEASDGEDEPRGGASAAGDGDGAPPAKRARVEAGGSGGGSGNGCSHPAYLGDLCVVCGAQRPDGDARGLSLRHVHAALDVSEAEAARLRAAEHARSRRDGKLQLLLDLDHTLLNSEKIARLEADGLLADLYALKGVEPPPSTKSTGSEGEGGGARGHIADFDPETLYNLRHIGMWTKLRPGARTFLREAARLFELSVYTMGARAYAEEMARLLDPDGSLFHGRIISKDDSTNSHTKSTDVTLADNRTVLIVDDTEVVWPNQLANLVNVDRYHFYPSSRKTSARGERTATDPGARPQMEAVLDSRVDECGEEGQLARVLEVIKRAHVAYFNNAESTQPDVRVGLASCRAEVLAGTVLLFTRVIPLEQARDARRHQLVRAAEGLGARVVHAECDEVTHVVAGAAGTGKARWGRKFRKHVVSPKWLWDCHFRWKHLDESQYPPKDA